MNAKKCKELRRQARALTIGKSETEYRRGSRTDAKGNKVRLGIEVGPQCTRGVYLALKKAA